MERDPRALVRAARRAPMTVRACLVTGSNRSGTTWVGQMLCHSRQLSYVHEPFNPGIWPRWTAVPIPYRNLYICADNEAAYLHSMGDVFAGRRPVVAQAREVRSIRDAGRLARAAVGRQLLRAQRRQTLVKDPIAIFSAPWLAERFDLSVVVMIRNPAAFASSIQRLGWGFNFRNWLDQDLLMRDLLGPYEREIIAMVDHEHDLIDQSILLWRAHYGVIDRFRSEHPDWHFVRWEDLAETPDRGFRELYGALGLGFDDRARRRIASDNAPGNPNEVASGDKGAVRRDSRAAARAWRHRLDERDFRRVQDGVADTATKFYEPEDWSFESEPS
jgi:hypothetical protein